jgi:enterochelin esterase family protein
MAKSEIQRFRLQLSLRRSTRFPQLQLNMHWLALYLAVAASLQAQQSTPPVSPEVHSDGRVTFRIRAPKASKVEVSGDWKPGQLEEMTKDTNGVWSTTLGPFEPSIYIYSFTLDGLAIADPVNPRVKLRAHTSASLVEVPAKSPDFWQPHDVPHGAVTINWQNSAVLNETRWMWVYTPPGYEKESKRRYPVLYLFHGSNDTAAGWTMVGYANFVLDNLLAEKRAVPMIVVMPFGHAVPFGSAPEIQARNTLLFEEYLMKDVMPLVESTYRVAAGRENRAIAGLSMGGGQSLQIGLRNLDRFSALAVFSASAPTDFETQFAEVLGNSKATNTKLKAFWIGCGKQDPAFPRAEKLSELLNAKQIKHTFRASEGPHTYTEWRKYLAEFAPLLFR